MTKCWQISGLPKMLLRGQRLDTFGWVICKCQSLAAIREKGAIKRLHSKWRREPSASRLPANPKTPWPLRLWRRQRLQPRPEPLWPTQLSNFLSDCIPVCHFQKAACQELDGHPSFTEGKRSCGWLPLEGETTGGSLCLGRHQGLSLLICEVGVRLAWQSRPD